MLEGGEKNIKLCGIIGKKCIYEEVFPLLSWQVHLRGCVELFWTIAHETGPVAGVAILFTVTFGVVIHGITLQLIDSRCWFRVKLGCNSHPIFPSVSAGVVKDEFPVWDAIPIACNTVNGNFTIKSHSQPGTELIQICE